jgi:hypothetical protein
MAWVRACGREGKGEGGGAWGRGYNVIRCSHQRKPSSHGRHRECGKARSQLRSRSPNTDRCILRKAGVHGSASQPYENLLRHPLLLWVHRACGSLLSPTHGPESLLQPFKQGLPASGAGAVSPVMHSHGLSIGTTRLLLTSSQPQQLSPFLHGKQPVAADPK